MQWDEDLGGLAHTCLECMELHTGVQLHGIEGRQYGITATSQVLIINSPD